MKNKCDILLLLMFFAILTIFSNIVGCKRVTEENEKVEHGCCFNHGGECGNEKDKVKCCDGTLDASCRILIQKY